jgi:beta-galactosidase/beta-glucuronidase
MSNARFSVRWILPVLGLVLSAAFSGLHAWEPVKGPLMTKWAGDVIAEAPHPEYPRPQMTRKQWISLNGLWDLAITGREASRPSSFAAQILVPFPVESALSGVMRRVTENDRLWYRRTFVIPKAWLGRRVLVNFGAVDFESVVYVNGREIGQHRGGYDAFSFDITDAIRTGRENEILVAVWDPTDAGTQPRGKQVLKPHGIWYTPTSGIWQTVWLEPVAAAHIQSIEITPDLDGQKVSVKAATTVGLGGFSIEAAAYDTFGKIADRSAAVGFPVDLPIKSPKLWSPESPHLYRLVVSLKLGGKTIDRVGSYFGMRKISLGRDENGFQRILLNNKPYFQFGPLDQGFWPDGLYTAPTDEALKYDIEMTKQFGFNMARKHVKIESARWYYWCDRLGLLVWQDMPSGDKHIGRKDPDIKRTPESAAQFERELAALVKGLYNHPSIVMWVPFNEGWGQYDTARITDLVKQMDGTRLVNNTSGWTDRGAGDVSDMHEYPGPASPEPEKKRAVVLGEFGGLGIPLKGHTWQDEKNWGYRGYTNAAALTEAYIQLVTKLYPLIREKGLSAAVYTQTTDVEIEVNGLMTYDREVLKLDPKVAAPVNRGRMPVAPVWQ